MNLARLLLAAFLVLAPITSFAQGPLVNTTVSAATPATATTAASPTATTITVPASSGDTHVVIPASSATATPDWLNALAVIGIAIVMSLVGWGLSIFNTKVGLDKNAAALAIEGQARDALHSALESLAGRAIVELGPKINTAILNIQNPTIRAVAQAAPGLAGDAITYFGLSPDTIAQKIIDKIGGMTASNPNANPTSMPASTAPATAATVATPAA